MLDVLVQCYFLIIAEWTEIVQSSKNFIRYGVPFPTRDQRKKVKHLLIFIYFFPPWQVSIGSADEEEDIPVDMGQTKRSRTRDEYQETDSGSDVEEYEYNESTSVLLEKLGLLKVENKRLRKELSLYKGMKEVVTGSLNPVFNHFIYLFFCNFWGQIFFRYLLNGFHEHEWVNLF